MIYTCEVIISYGKKSMACSELHIQHTCMTVASRFSISGKLTPACMLMSVLIKGQLSASVYPGVFDPLTFKTVKKFIIKSKKDNYII